MIFRKLPLGGQWLSGAREISEQETELLELLLAELQDSNTDIANESVRALAFILAEKQSWLETYVSRIIKSTKDYINLRHIGYLTNLAFLYRKLEDWIGDDEVLKEIVQQVIQALNTSPYSNVRRELKK